MRERERVSEFEILCVRERVSLSERERESVCVWEIEKVSEQ